MALGESAGLVEVPSELLGITASHVQDLLRLAIEHRPERRAVVVADSESPLVRLLTAAYRISLPEARFLAYDAASPGPVLEAFAALEAGDLVVLLQSSSFRLEAFRIRIELFKRGLKVVEHPHLARILPDEYATYVEALAYDADYYRGIGAKLKARIDAASGAVVASGEGAQLYFDSVLEPAKLNVGDYSALANVGGQFPIGEVFSEAVDLTRVHGRVRIFAFGAADFSLAVPEAPITLVVEGGQVVGTEGSTPAFDAVLAQIKATEHLWLRELGFGMNRAMTAERRVNDVGTYERMCGIHLSLGAKHAIYNKPLLNRRHTRHHVDVFAITESVTLGGEAVFQDGGWRV